MPRKAIRARRAGTARGTTTVRTTEPRTATAPATASTPTTTPTKIMTKPPPRSARSLPSTRRVAATSDCDPGKGTHVHLARIRWPGNDVVMPRPAARTPARRRHVRQRRYWSGSTTTTASMTAPRPRGRLCGPAPNARSGLEPVQPELVRIGIPVSPRRVGELTGRKLSSLPDRVDLYMATTWPLHGHAGVRWSGAHRDEQPASGNYQPTLSPQRASTSGRIASRGAVAARVSIRSQPRFRDSRHRHDLLSRDGAFTGNAGRGGVPFRSSSDCDVSGRHLRIDSAPFMNELVVRDMTRSSVANDLAIVAALGVSRRRCPPLSKQQVNIRQR